jgi:hypothetical protein
MFTIEGETISALETYLAEVEAHQGVKIRLTPKNTYYMDNEVCD